MLTEIIDDLNEELQELQNSQLAKQIEDMIESRRDIRGIQGIGDQSKSMDILEKAPILLNKVGKFAAEISKDSVYNFVKFFGGKFKPWGATKLTKFINKLGPALSIVGTILETVITVKEEKREAKFEQELREARAKIRKDFREVAQDMSKEYEKNLQENIYPIFINELNNIEESLFSIA